jgi:hypothetical protein
MVPTRAKSRFLFRREHVLVKVAPEKGFFRNVTLCSRAEADIIRLALRQVTTRAPLSFTIDLALI